MTGEAWTPHGADNANGLPIKPDGAAALNATRADKTTWRNNNNKTKQKKTSVRIISKFRLRIVHV